MVRQAEAVSRPFYIADIACGAGFASRGFIDRMNQHGIEVEVLAAVDPWGPAVATYAANIPEARGRVFQTTAEDALERGLVPMVDLVIGGPPCVRDSTLMLGGGHKKKLRESRVEELAAVKAAFRDIACIAPMSVMETVGSKWRGYRGGKTAKLHDDRLGGFTIRQRTLITWGLDHAPTETVPSPGWGAVIPWFNRPPFVMVNDASSAKKRAKRSFWRPPNKPAQSVLGGGSAHIILDARTGQKVVRLPPAGGAALQGFPGYRLEARLVRDRQKLVGRGWARSFGAWVADSVVVTAR